MSTFALVPFLKRFVQYGLVGVSTYLLDLLLIYTFKTFFAFPDWLAVGIGFLIAVSINYLISYFWVFKGTERDKVAGYVFFICISVTGLIIIVTSTVFIKNYFLVDLYVARTIVAGFVGTANYLLNSFFNFKITS